MLLQWARTLPGRERRPDGQSLHAQIGSKPCHNYLYTIGEFRRLIQTFPIFHDLSNFLKSLKIY